MTAIREAGAPVLASFGYDALGRRVRVGRGDGSVTTYGYDAGSRLTALAHDLTGTANDVRYTFAYNPAGQIVSETRDNDAYAWTGHGNTDRAESVDGLNRVTQAGPNAATYDARGNTTAIGGMMYGYDRRNRLQQAGTGYLYYDTLGDLTTTVAAGVTRLYEKEPDGSIAIERDGNGATLRRYITAPGETEPVMWYDGPGLNGTGAFNRRWAYADPRGSIVAVADESGGVTINRYDPYGVPAAGNTGTFGYTGQLWLPWAALYHYQARAYNPAIGRFMQTDPIGYAGGMNLYGYVAGDPVNRTDPSGLCDVSTGRTKLRNECVVRVEPEGDIVVEARQLKRECNACKSPASFLERNPGFGTGAGPGPGNAGEGGSGEDDIVVTVRRIISVAANTYNQVLARFSEAIDYFTLQPSPACCFTAGTLVSIPGGMKAIDAFKVGDMVISRNDKTGQTAPKPIISITPAHERRIWTVTISYKGEDGRWSDERYETTDDHPWRTADGQWIASAALKPGQTLAREDGTAIVAGVVDTGTTKLTYNLEVADFHTYFVGKAETWVHNECLEDTLLRISRGERYPHRNDGSIFRNQEGILPRQPSGYYKEYVHPTSGQSGPGAQRVVIGAGGEIYLTTDHYESFRKIK